MSNLECRTPKEAASGTSGGLKLSCLRNLRHSAFDIRHFGTHSRTPNIECRISNVERQRKQHRAHQVALSYPVFATFAIQRSIFDILEPIVERRISNVESRMSNAKESGIGCVSWTYCALR